MKPFNQSNNIVAQKYQIINTLGEGGSGITYLAQDLQNNKIVALKALSLHRMTDWKAIELFEREAKILAQLNHPAIPDYLEYFDDDTNGEKHFYIAQQLAPGKSLAKLVEENWRTNEQQIKNIAKQILEILIYLHSLTPSVTHRDIKPQNIIYDNKKVFLVDFGAVQDTYYSTFMRGSTVVGNLRLHGSRAVSRKSRTRNRFIWFRCNIIIFADTSLPRRFSYGWFKNRLSQSNKGIRGFCRLAG